MTKERVRVVEMMKVGNESCRTIDEEEGRVLSFDLVWRPPQTLVPVVGNDTSGPSCGVANKTGPDCLAGLKGRRKRKHCRKTFVGDKG